MSLQGAWLIPLVEPVTLDLEVVNSSSTLGQSLLRKSKQPRVCTYISNSIQYHGFISASALPMSNSVPHQ